MKLSEVYFSITILGALLSTGVAGAAIQNLHVNSGSTKFLAIGRPSLLKIHGEGAGPKGELTIKDNVVEGQLEVDLTTFKTGVDMRDDHMKNKYLEVAKFPKAILTVKGLKMPPTDQLPKEVPFEGTLSLHGETQAIKDGKVQLAKSGDKITFTAKFQTNITGHKIDIPSYAGVRVAETIDVEVQSEAVMARAPGMKEAANK